MHVGKGEPRDSSPSPIPPPLPLTHSHALSRRLPHARAPPAPRLRLGWRRPGPAEPPCPLPPPPPVPPRPPILRRRGCGAAPRAPLPRSPSPGVGTVREAAEWAAPLVREPVGCCSPSAPRFPISSCGAASTVPRARPPPRWAASRGPARPAAPARPARRRYRPGPRPTRRRGPRAARDGPPRATGGATHLREGAPARPCAEVASPTLPSSRAASPRRCPPRKLQPPPGFSLLVHYRRCERGFGNLTPCGRCRAWRSELQSNFYLTLQLPLRFYLPSLTCVERFFNLRADKLTHMFAVCSWGRRVKHTHKLSSSLFVLSFKVPNVCDYNNFFFERWWH